VLSGPADRTSWLYAHPPLPYSYRSPGTALKVLGNKMGESRGRRMAAQRSKARSGMIRRRADVVASKTGCQIAAPTRECLPEPLEATPESRRFQATSVMASCFSNPKEPPQLGVPTTPPTAPSWARRPRAATTGVERARDDPRVIVPARRLLLRRPVGLPSTLWEIFSTGNP